jgi:4-amino-4-deoxy-L-arabinose transferase-like glycosyltransferase
VLRPPTSPSALRAPRPRGCALVRGRHAVVAILFVTVICGAALRTVGTRWDGGAHLHPDERYLSTVADNVALPGSFTSYFDVRESPLSPYRTEPGRDYLYGLLPLSATKLVATAVGEDGYDQLYLVGRRLGAALDSLLIAVVFAIGLLTSTGLGRRRAVEAALVAAALYAVTVTSIQHAHYFTTDVWLVFFGTVTFLLASLGLRRGVGEGAASPAPLVILVGAALGLTVACKVSGAFVALPVALALLGRALAFARSLGKAGGHVRRTVLRLAVEGTTVLVAAYLTFRAVSPYTFARSSWLDVTIEPRFRDALETQARAVAGPSSFPPSYQWLRSTPLWTPLENLALWQLGVPLALAALLGLALLSLHSVRVLRKLPAAHDRGVALVADAVAPLMLVSYVLVLFVSVASRFVHSGRYLLPLAPLLAVSAAYALAAATKERPRLWRAAAAVVVGATVVWALAFVRVYTEPNTRIAASSWLRANVPVGATIANEHWDDPLPVRALWAETATVARALGGYHGVLLPVFDPDGPEKLQALYRDLAAADYYVVSSPRASDTVGRMPDRFPLMTRFYRQLFAGRLGFVEARRFESYPGFLGIRIPDGRAEEAFWVYDHAPVVVFRRDGELQWKAFRAALCPRARAAYCG